MNVARTVFGIDYAETRRIVDELWDERPHGWYWKNKISVKVRAAPPA